LVTIVSLFRKALEFTNDSNWFLSSSTPIFCLAEMVGKLPLKLIKEISIILIFRLAEEFSNIFDIHIIKKIIY
jgi:hypothetical protein